MIEHLEEAISPWLLLEYRHVSMMCGRDRVVFTNVPKRFVKLLIRYGAVSEKSVVDMVRGGELSCRDVLVLDPQAEGRLSYEDLLRYKYIVVGGILGDNPPRGRTRALITCRLPGCAARNIGEGQYSIDGAVYYVLYLARNRTLEGYAYVDGVSIETEEGEVYLPFRYPVVGGKPLIAPGLEYYLKYRRIPPELEREVFNAGPPEEVNGRS